MFLQRFSIPHLDLEEEANAAPPSGFMVIPLVASGSASSLLAWAYQQAFLQNQQPSLSRSVGSRFLEPSLN